TWIRGLQFLPIHKRAHTAKASQTIVSMSPAYAATEVAGTTRHANGSFPKPRENRSHQPIHTIQTAMRDTPSDRDCAVCFKLMPVTNHNPNMAIQDIQMIWLIQSRTTVFSIPADTSAMFSKFHLKRVVPCSVSSYAGYV